MDSGARRGRGRARRGRSEEGWIPDFKKRAASSEMWEAVLGQPRATNRHRYWGPGSIDARCQEARSEQLQVGSGLGVRHGAIIRTVIGAPKQKTPVSKTQEASLGIRPRRRSGV